MAEIINLRRARKAKARSEKDKTAEANRVAHGTPKALRKLERAKTEQARERLSGKQLQDEPDEN
jgi:hypothetical protein